MKKTLFRSLLAFALLLVMTFGEAKACDLCSFYVGLNPQYNQNQIGLRYRFRSFSGAHSHFENVNHGDDADLEQYHTWELWGRFYPTPKMRVFVTAPFSRFTSYSHDTLTESVSGFGDVSALAAFQIFQVIPDDSARWGHRLWLGGGLSAPTGKWGKDVPLGYYNPLVMPGSGAFSGLAHLSYIAKGPRLGFGLNYNFRKSLRNPHEYRFADRHNLNANMFYEINAGGTTLMPMAGVFAEYANRDDWDRTAMPSTGGFAGLANAGLEWYAGPIVVSAMAQLPVYQNLYDDQAKNTIRVISGVYYSF